MVDYSRFDHIGSSDEEEEPEPVRPNLGDGQIRRSSDGMFTHPLLPPRMRVMPAFPPECFHGVSRADFEDPNFYPRQVLNDFLRHAEDAATAEGAVGTGIVAAASTFITQILAADSSRAHPFHQSLNIQVDTQEAEDGVLVKFLFAWSLKERVRITQTAGDIERALRDVGFNRHRVAMVLGLALFLKYVHVPFLRLSRQDLQQEEARLWRRLDSNWRKIVHSQAVGEYRVLMRHLPCDECTRLLRGFLETSVSTEICSNCDQELPRNQMQRCSRCRQVYYCSQECQEQHWRAAFLGHRRQCNRIVNAGAAANI